MAAVRSNLETATRRALLAAAARAAWMVAGLFVAGVVALPSRAATILVYKLGVDATGANSIDADPYNGWANAGGFNIGNATAMSLSNTTLDYKDSFVDSNWSSVTSVTVGMYQAGSLISFMQFSPGTSKLDFYAPSNLTSSSYNDLLPFGGNFFSESGDDGIARRWFVENNYGGCGNDTGWFVVEGQSASMPCTWETSRRNAAGREFLFAEPTTRENWNNTDGSIGLADVFAISVTTADVIPMPEPASVAIVATSLLGAGLVRRRRTKKR